MSPAGRPRKPTPLKVLEGNPGKRPLPKNEIEPPATSGAQPPAWLRSRAALEAWHDLVPKLEKLRLLTELDIPALAMLCQVYAKVQRGGTAEDRRQLKMLLGEFGMTPATRSKVAAAEAQQPESTWAKLDGMGA